MKLILYPVLLALIVFQANQSHGQISINALPFSPSVTDFDSYNPSSATDFSATLPTGWSGVSSGTAAYRGQGVGTSLSGGNWAYGGTGDYSLGALHSTIVGDITYSVNFINNSGTTIGSLLFSWDYKQFRFANNSGWECSGIGALSGNATLDAKDFNGSSTGTNGIPVTTCVSPFTLTNLSIANNATFGISWTTTDSALADNGVSIDNFVVRANQSALPIRIAKLEVLSKSASTIALRWKIESSEALRSTVLERSWDGLGFAPVKAFEEINAKNSSETFLDKKPNSGLNVYRLRMTDLVGNVSFSASQVVRIEGKSLAEATVFPNPCAAELKVSFPFSEQPTEAFIINFFGQPVRNFKSVQSGAGLDVSNIPAGQYLLQIVRGNEKRVLVFRRM
ncbi:MAG: T9SS type A sorting domain-containing protein [Chitinophagaceae bacterium]